MAKKPKELKKDLGKASKNKETRQRKSKISTTGIEIIRRTVDRMKPYELSPSQRYQTYLAMLQDPDVFTPYFANIVMVEKAFSNYKISFDKESSKSEEVADFMHYCINQVLKQTPRAFAGNAATFKKDKVALFEKSWKKGEEEYKDFWCLYNLAYIDPITLDTKTPFVITCQGDGISHIRQRTDAFLNSEDVISKYKVSSSGFVEIPANKVAFVTDSTSDTQPYGTSVFDAIYSEWRYKTLIKEVTLTGVTKDFSGTPVLYVPNWLQEEANGNPDGWEAAFLADLQRDMANMHVGDQAYVNLPSDPHEGATSLREFEIKFLGVEGGGKAFDVTALMEQSKKAIYNAFGAANLLAGDGGGSYNLIEGQNTIHTHFIQRDIAIIEEVWNKDIWKQTFRLNGFNLKWNEVPIFKAGEIEPVSLEELGKFLQRTGAVGLLPSKSASFLNEIYEKFGVAFRFDSKASPEDVNTLTGEVTSRSGDGMKEGMSNGVGKSSKGGDNSTGNKEH